MLVVNVSDLNIRHHHPHYDHLNDIRLGGGEA